MVLALFSACSNEDMLPESPNEGPVQLASVSVGSMTRGSIVDDNFVFGSGDKVVMNATVNSTPVSNTFTYNGSKWTQDAPEGSYSLICIQDSPTIESIVSYGGNATAPADGGRNQNSEVSYIAADELKADVSMIEFADGMVSATLAHANSDFVVKVRDGEGSANVLNADTPVLTVTIDQNGPAPGSETYDYITWNTGKSQDEYGDWYTTFRVILPAGCSIIKATLSKANATAGDATTDIKFYWTASGDPSDIEALKQGTRYSATYEYNQYISMATVGISIMPFDEYAEQDITATKDWSFDETTKTYTVFTAEGLQIVNKDIAENIKTKKDYNITLAADITLPNPVAPETSNWIPLGKYDESSRPYFFCYEGTFDGAGHTISNLRINDGTSDFGIGLIGLIGDGGTVKNLTLDKPEIISTLSNYVGGFVGNFDTSAESSLITNCHIRGGIIKSPDEAGGIAGSYYGNIIACTVSETTIEGYVIGGIVGTRYFSGSIIACGVNEVNFILSYSNAYVGGIVGYLNAVDFDGNDTYIYSCYAKDCTKGTDLQALEGMANLTSVIRIYENCTVTVYNCAYRTKGSSITYGVGATKTGTADEEYTADMFITETGTPGGDWTTAVTELNAGINFWNSFAPTLPCNWEWDATEEGKLKVKQ